MKPIKLDKEIVQSLRDIFIAQLDKQLVKVDTDTTLTLKYNVSDLMKKQGALKEEDKPLLIFTARAWLKMNELVHFYSSEVAAHGTVIKMNNDYFITDIFVYPQDVSGVTAESSDDYITWLSDLEDEQINTMRFQFHSHVNMGVTPSVVDREHRTQMLTHIKDFYIFAILNKKRDMHCEVYDIETNTLYEDNDISYTILMEDETDLQDWVLDTCSVVNEVKIKPTKKTTPPVTPGYPPSWASYTQRQSYFDDYDDYYEQLPATTNTTKKGKGKY